MPPPPPYQMQPVAAATTYGGFWIRFVAIFIDGLIVGVPLGIVLSIISAATNSSSSNPSPTFVVFELIAFLIEAAYFVCFWSTGSTLGMRIFKLRVVDANTGQPIGVGRAVLRYVGYIISAVVCYIGLIWAAFDSRKQGWHDKIAGTVVLQG